MSDRYTRVFTLENNLYSEGAPVIVEAGVILKDNKKPRILAQLKYKNISASVSPIIAMDVILHPFDIEGQPLDEEVRFRYLDMSVPRDAEFGSKTAVPLPNASTRSFTVSIVKVIYADRITEEVPKTESAVLPARVLLSKSLDSEMLKQYYLEIGSDSRYEELEYKDLWYCICGAVNRSKEEACHNCKRRLDDLKAVSLTEMEQRKELRLQKEAERRAEQARIEKEKREEARREEEKARLEAKEKAKIEAEKRARKQKAARRAVIITLTAIALIAAGIVLTVKIIFPNIRYNEAVKLKDAGQYEEAIAAFEAMAGYKDSSEQIEECKTGIKDLEYDAAAALKDAGQYEEAIAAFEAMAGYKDSAEQIADCKYNYAISLIETDPIEAFDRLIALGDYRDSAEKASDIFGSVKAEEIYRTAVGEYVYFGSYEQDNNTSNGKEEIEWLILAKENGKALLISRYGLERQLYNTDQTDMTWEDCSLRKWLNESFYQEAFEPGEQKAILSSTVTADKNPSYNSDSGRATTDKVFLLSTDEAEKYFTSDMARQCRATSSAAGTNPTSRCSWWLRSPGGMQKRAASVSESGEINYLGNYVNYINNAIRPALWFDLNP